jgi:hypothetical protein
MACTSAVPLYTTSITKTSISVSWGAVDTVFAYQVEYKLNDPLVVVWTLLPQQTTTSATISPLAENTEYVIRVNTICQDETNCYSVSIVSDTSQWKKYCQ